MTPATGLRVRIAASIAAAAIFALAVLAVAILGVLGDVVYDRRASDAADAVLVIASACRDSPDRVACVRDAGARAGGQAVVAGRGSRSAAVVVGSGSHQRIRVYAPFAREEEGVEMELTLDEEREALAEAGGRLLLWVLLAGVLLLAASMWLLDRTLVRRLLALEQTLEHAPEGFVGALMPEGGDAIGRMGAALNRSLTSLREQTDLALGRERALREARDSMARSDKLATVGRLAAGVAHEIGNPLAAILGYVEILRARHGNDAAIAEYLDRAEHEVKRIDRIVRDLLDFSRPGTKPAGAVRLQESAEQALRLASSLKKWKGMEVVSELPADLPAVLAEEHYVVQVLVNLMVNAADACDGKGRVVVRARRLPADDMPRRRAGDPPPVAGVELVVEDTGPGFRDEHLARIFEPFFTTKEPGEGTGLGLAICHRVMEGFGGTIAASNRPEGGARITLRFRAAAGDADQRADVS